ncbi:hypothetical protein GCM10010123_45970 [Pilimelia anulata]|uniref:Uncharacterized protein n=1 Tax=Pilimelia anulata TaxID=53371 RepID=A0A8J3BCD2_9ACTN|nr:hypothetical protein [Pilimelia anulata]GGK10817.1 hypothetical protein GCM10010123_45970 [Pilimelia anulata]
MTTPDEQDGPAQISLNEHPHLLATITGPTEAAVLHKAAEWLESFDGCVVVLATSWRGDVAELTSEPDAPLYQLDLTVDMSIAASEGRWPRDWFHGHG